MKELRKVVMRPKGEVDNVIDLTETGGESVKVCDKFIKDVNSLLGRAREVTSEGREIPGVTMTGDGQETPLTLRYEKKTKDGKTEVIRMVGSDPLESKLYGEGEFNPSRQDETLASLQVSHRGEDGLTTDGFVFEAKGDGQIYEQSHEDYPPSVVEGDLNVAKVGAAYAIAEREINKLMAAHQQPAPEPIAA
ncbi:MAG TPA: hypothetical protein VHB51_00075 [Candidatus Saccharimonadales bacterium]|nr:hypothetical protein [Candidatus Saccharimonadales bacterium]